MVGKILKYRTDPFGRKGLARFLGVTEKTVGRYLSDLISANEVKHRGSKKTGGYWVVSESRSGRLVVSEETR